LCHQPKQFIATVIDAIVLVVAFIKVDFGVIVVVGGGVALVL